MTSDRGILYWACGGERYVEWAAGSARSAKRHMPRIPAAIQTPLVESKYLKIFDKVIPCSPPPQIDWQGEKITTMLQSPFRYTLYLDCDTVVCDDVSGLFELVEGSFDVALTFCTRQRSRYPFPDTPELFPYYSSGAMALDMNADTIAMLTEWREEYECHKHLQSSIRKKSGKPFHPDQDLLHRVLYRSNVRAVTLPEEYNCTFWTGAVQGKVKILHVHGAGGRKLERMAERLNRDWKKPRLYKKREIIG